MTSVLMEALTFYRRSNYRVLGKLGSNIVISRISPGYK
jgi:hypothetical protein